MDETPAEEGPDGTDQEAAVELVETSEPGLFLATGDLSVFGTDVVPLTLDAGRSRTSGVDKAAVGAGGAKAAAAYERAALEQLPDVYPLCQPRKRQAATEDSRARRGLRRAQSGG